MTISEMAIVTLVASPSTIYLECEGKRYRDAVELTKDHGNRLIRSASIHAGGGIEIELEPQEEFDLKAILDDLKAILDDLPDTIDVGTIEAPGFPEELGRPDYDGDGDLADAEKEG